MKYKRFAGVEEICYEVEDICYEVEEICWSRRDLL